MGDGQFDGCVAARRDPILPNCVTWSLKEMSGVDDKMSLLDIDFGGLKMGNYLLS